MTMQIQDNLIFQDKSYNLSGGSINPFGGLENAETIRKDFARRTICSALWRGYIAVWIVDEFGWLKLSNITTDIFLEDENAQPKNLLYGIYKNHDSPVTATWVTGEIEVSHGNIIGDCGLYINVYEEYLNIRFSNGKVLNIQALSGDEWRIKKNCAEKAYKLPSFLKT